MREIKFRAWNKKLKEWVSDFYYFASFNQYGGLDYEPYVILEQFTGLKDKNGVDIYEGDICKFIVKGIEYTATLKYGLKSCAFKFKVDYDAGWKKIHKYYAIPSSKHIEVIGNIHDKN